MGLAFVFALKRFKPLQSGRHFTLFINHYLLLKIFGPTDKVYFKTSVFLQRFANFFGCLNYSVVYKK